MCVTFARGLSPEEVFTRYGADPGRARLLNWSTASDLVCGDAGVSLLRAGKRGEWTFRVGEYTRSGRRRDRVRAALAAYAGQGAVMAPVMALVLMLRGCPGDHERSQMTSEAVVTVPRWT